MTESQGRRQFMAVAEPAVVPNVDDHPSDEAVLESILENENMRILLEVKGSKKVPTFSVFAREAELTFSQLIQKVALALESKMWKDEVMAGMVTRDIWYLFRIKDKSDSNGNMRMEIKVCYYIELKNPGIEGNNASVHQCLCFIKRYLHECI